MQTLVRQPAPAEFEALLRDREARGLDRWDEVWDGVLHMNPPPNTAHEFMVMAIGRTFGPLADAVGLEIAAGVGLGPGPNQYRRPDVTLLRSDYPAQWHDTVPLLVEILSPGDETFEKFPYYAEHRVDEVVIVNVDQRSVQWLALRGGEYVEVDTSTVLGVAVRDVALGLRWPRAQTS